MGERALELMGKRALQRVAFKTASATIYHCLWVMAIVRSTLHGDAALGTKPLSYDAGGRLQMCITELRNAWQWWWRMQSRMVLAHLKGSVVFSSN